ncbi:Carboxypeptidase regulatory-like domain protein [uncultured archaeon]|nr:Carboxypeptidase regulatory-like domain protein [uncultured archaeon]
MIWFNATIPNNPPVQQPIGNKVIDENTLLQFTVISTDLDYDAISYGTNASKGTFNITTGQFSWTPGNGDSGNYTWYFNSTDNYGGKANETITITVKIGTSSNCLGCHNLQKGIYPAIVQASFGRHNNVNVTGGSDVLDNNDCVSCHYNISNMTLPGITTATFTCIDCHAAANFSAPIVKNHIPSGASIKTSSDCSTCHNNSITAFAYNPNASVGHYGTNVSLLKPTVNNTLAPAYGFMSQGEASNYNKECNSCHNPPNPNYGTSAQIKSAHTSLATCNQCHVSGNADNLHNGSLSMPLTRSCIGCHSLYADQYSAPNLTGTNHKDYDCSYSCHIPTDNGTLGQFDPVDHNTDWTFSPGNPPTTDTVYLNGTMELTVMRGETVTITSRIKDYNYLASRVRGAEYYIRSDHISPIPGPGKGKPMGAVDGRFDAVNGGWEDITGSINTSGLSLGTHYVYVRGMDIGKQWSTPVTAIITITESKGFINGTVREGLTGISGVMVAASTGISTVTDNSGFYSLHIPNGTYVLNASKLPEYNSNNTIPPVIVAPFTTVTQDILLTRKPVYQLNGRLTNASSGLGINGALVKLDAYPQYNVTSNITGDYSMNVPGDRYQVSATASGYSTNVTTLLVNKNMRQDFILNVSSGIFIPWIAYSQSDWYTPIQVQNIGSSTSTVSVSMYDQTGNLVTTQIATIQPNTASVFWPPIGQTTGGTAIITSTQKVVAIVNEMPKNGLDGMSYNGFTQGSTKVYIPWIAYSQSDWYTPIQVQNIDSTSANVSVSMFDQNGNPLAIQTAAIQPNTASVFWPPAGPTTGGSAVITSTRNVIAIVNEMSKVTSQAMSYEGFNTGSRKAYIPAINFSQTNTYTPIQVQNIGTASASVNVKIYDSNGALVQTQNGVIPPNTASVFWPPAASTTSGSAVIESTQDIIAIVNAMINNNNWAMSYDGFAAGSVKVSIPWIAYGNSGWNTPVYVQNTGTVNANVALSFYDQNGAPVETRNAVIPANTSQIFVPASTALTTGGSAVVVSSQPVAAEISEIDATSNMQALAYGGVLV